MTPRPGPAEDDERPREQSGAYAVVHSMKERPIVACTIFNERDAPIAHRQWVLEPDGIHIYCACGKDGKPVKVRMNPDGSSEIAEPFHDECSETIAPEPIDSVHRQLTQEIEGFADDWETRPIKYYYKEGSRETASRRLKLGGLWQDEDALDYAAATWYIIEGERLLDDIEKTTKDLDAVRKKWEQTPPPAARMRRSAPESKSGE